MSSHELGYRSRSDSRLFNKLQLETVEEIHALFDRCRSVETAMNETQTTLSTENAYLNQRIAELHVHTDTVRNLGGGRWQEFIPACDLEIERGTAYLAYGVVVPELIAPPVSKLTLELAGETIIPQSCQISIEPPADGAQIRDYNPQKALIGGQSVWRRTVSRSLNEAGGTVEATYTVQLPTSIISNRDLNLITLSPWPSFTVDVLDVAYYQQGAWHTVPGFQPINEAGPLFIPTPTLTATALRVKLRQRHGLNEGRYVSHLGLHQLGACRADYAKDPTLLRATSLLRGTGPWVIESIEPRYSNSGTGASWLFNYNLIAKSLAGAETPLGSGVPVTTTLPVLEIEGHLEHHGTDPVPALEGVVVTYVSADNGA